MVESSDCSSEKEFLFFLDDCKVRRGKKKTRNKKYFADSEWSKDAGSSVGHLITDDAGWGDDAVAEFD